MIFFLFIYFSLGLGLEPSTLISVLAFLAFLLHALLILIIPSLKSFFAGPFFGHGYATNGIGYGSGYGGSFGGGHVGGFGGGPVGFGNGGFGTGGFGTGGRSKYLRNNTSGSLVKISPIKNVARKKISLIKNISRKKYLQLKISYRQYTSNQ